MKNKRLLMFLPILPMLMANAPAPKAYPKNYTDFEMSVVKEEVNAEYPTLYDYTFNLKNTGVGYISTFYATSEECSNFSYYFGSLGFSFSYNCVLAPNQQREVVAAEAEKINDYSKIRFTADAYFDFADDVTVSGDLSLSRSSSGKNTYKVNAELSGGDRTKYNYGLILKLTYDGDDYYLEVDQFEDFSFDNKDEFDVNKVTNIEVVEVTRSITYGYRENNNMGNVFISALLMPLFIILGLIALVVVVTIVCVVIVSAKKRKKQSGLANQESDSSQSDN